MGRLSRGAKRRAQVCADWWLAAWASWWGSASSRASHWLGVHTWHSLAGPKLEVGTKIRDAAGYESSPSCLGPVVTGLVVRLPGCLLEIVV